jgi:enterochelin esterase-like enzyme
LIKDFFKVFVILLFSLTTGSASTEEIVFGTLSEEVFESKFLGERRLLIYSPSKEVIDQDTTFIIIQDGQYLFDGKVNWRDEEWGIDETLQSLNKKNKLPNIVVVGVENAARTNGGKLLDESKRYAEYFPKQAIKYFGFGFRKFAYQNFVDLEKFDYIKFLEEELIPYLEDKFERDMSSKNMGILGSSMGGLISLNALIELPHRFGFAASLSTHWIGIRPLDYALFPFRSEIRFFGDPYTTEAIYSYIIENIDELREKKIYLDRGTESLDQFYEGPQNKIDEIFSSNALTFQSLVFEGFGHNPKDFGKRFEGILNFILKENR